MADNQQNRTNPAPVFSTDDIFNHLREHFIDTYNLPVDSEMPPETVENYYRVKIEDFPPLPLTAGEKTHLVSPGAIKQLSDLGLLLPDRPQPYHVRHIAFDSQADSLSPLEKPIYIPYFLRTYRRRPAFTLVDKIPYWRVFWNTGKNLFYGEWKGRGIISSRAESLGRQKPRGISPQRAEDYSKVVADIMLKHMFPREEELLRYFKRYPAAESGFLQYLTGVMMPETYTDNFIVNNFGNPAAGLASIATLKAPALVSSGSKYLGPAFYGMLQLSDLAEPVFQYDINNPEADAVDRYFGPTFVKIFTQKDPKVRDNLALSELPASMQWQYFGAKYLLNNAIKNPKTGVSPLAEAVVKFARGQELTDSEARLLAVYGSAPFPIQIKLLKINDTSAPAENSKEYANVFYHLFRNLMFSGQFDPIEALGLARGKPVSTADFDNLYRVLNISGDINPTEKPPSQFNQSSSVSSVPLKAPYDLFSFPGTITKTPYNILEPEEEEVIFPESFTTASPLFNSPQIRQLVSQVVAESRQQKPQQQILQQQVLPQQVPQQQKLQQQIPQQQVPQQQKLQQQIPQQQVPQQQMQDVNVPNMYDIKLNLSSEDWENLKTIKDSLYARIRPYDNLTTFLNKVFANPTEQPPEAIQLTEDEAIKLIVELEAFLRENPWAGRFVVNFLERKGISDQLRAIFLPEKTQKSKTITPVSTPAGVDKDERLKILLSLAGLDTLGALASFFVEEPKNVQSKKTISLNDKILKINVKRNIENWPALKSIIDQQIRAPLRKAPNRDSYSALESFLGQISDILSNPTARALQITADDLINVMLGLNSLRVNDIELFVRVLETLSKTGVLQQLDPYLNLPS